MKHLSVRVANLPEEFPVIEAIRRAVFHEEQGVDPALDFDGKDQISEQFLAYLDNQPVGTARIRYLDDTTAKIERLAVLSSARGQGIAKKIMEKCLDVIASKNVPEVEINAQVYVKGLYQQLGFEEEGERFEDASISHVKMRKKLR